VIALVLVIIRSKQIIDFSGCARAKIGRFSLLRTGGDSYGRDLSVLGYADDNNKTACPINLQLKRPIENNTIQLS
jgi:hypothetical protein